MGFANTSKWSRKERRRNQLISELRQALTDAADNLSMAADLAYGEAALSKYEYDLEKDFVEDLKAIANKR